MDNGFSFKEIWLKRMIDNYDTQEEKEIARQLILENYYFENRVSFVLGMIGDMILPLSAFVCAVAVLIAVIRC